MLAPLFAIGQNSTVLSSGTWFKLSVKNDGIYKIDYNLLRRAGLNPDQIDPNKIKIYGGLNGMLPQPNSSPRPADLTELSIFVSGASDGKFNSGDFILFFGQGPDIYQLPPAKGKFSYQNNLYTDKNYYFITVGTTDGKRMSTISNISGTFPVVSEFDDFGYYETEQYNVLHSGRDWFGELFDSKTDYTIRFDAAGIIDGTAMTLISGVMGRSEVTASFQFYVNDVVVKQKDIPTVIVARYTDWGVKVADTVSFNSNSVGASSRSAQDVRVHFNKASSGTSIAYLDYLLLQYKRRLSLYGDQTIFHSLKSLDQVVTQYSITGIPSGGVIWDVTDPFNAKIQEITIATSTTFSATSDILKKFIAAKTFPAPSEEGVVSNQNIHGISSVNLVIVTPPAFLTEAQRLADYRISSNGLTVSVVTTDQIYNEFSGGKQDVTAIRDMARYLYTRNTGMNSLLMFGRGSYDYKNILPNNKNFVPIYQSRNSLSPLETYASDDYFGFLENSEGNWGESPAENHTLDIGVGRLPVKKIEEAQIVVNKLIEYENQNWGDWRKEILFVADDGDFNIHQSQADQLAENIESGYPEFNTQKIYVDDFKQVTSSIGQISPDATKALSRAVSDGVVIMNYTGHGNETQLMQERILDQVSLDQWKTGPRYPLLVTATCEFGRNDDPDLISTAELSMFKQKAGSLGLVTTSRPVSSSTNFTLNTAFYQALFSKTDNQFHNLGTIFKDTKNLSVSGVSNRNFILLGDPSMKLALPVSDIQITSVVNQTSGSDTLKALSKVRVSGRVITNGIPNTTFKGILEAALFDKLTNHTTKGDENSPFSFTTRDNAVFRGQATVSNGLFDMDFILPKSMDPNVSLGKIALYAYSKTGNTDVTGQGGIPKIGSLEKSPGTDTKSPMVDLFMGDTSFVSGGIAGSSSRIVAILSDENGINTSGYSGNGITAILDDTVTLTLNKYYESDLDNYKRGKVNYPINNLKPGYHYLILKATDTFGNTGTASITFFVSDQSGIQIEQWLNYPNPVISSTTFHFKHNRSGEDLEAMVTLFNSMGQPMLTSTYQINNSSYQVDLPAWDTTYSDGTKLSGGLYLLKLSVRSLVDGSKNEKITKVIISN